MPYLVKILLLELLLLLYVFHHVPTRVPSCNARKRMKLQEGAAYRNHLRGTFEEIVLKDLLSQGKLKEASKRNNLQDRKQEDGAARKNNQTSERLRQSLRGRLGKPKP